MREYHKEYHDDHRLCPICHVDMIEVTTMGWWDDVRGNPNRAYCGCGWKGMEDDLVK